MSKQPIGEDFLILLRISHETVNKCYSIVPLQIQESNEWFDAESELLEGVVPVGETCRRTKHSEEPQELQNTILCRIEKDA
jgi:hypothetical protein